MVPFGSEAAKRQPKAILTGQLAVTATLIAAIACEQRNNFVDKRRLFGHRHRGIDDIVTRGFCNHAEDQQGADTMGLSQKHRWDRVHQVGQS